MKKLFYYLLFPSILFSQTTPSVTPRVDGEGSLGTETYRWGEGHFVEAYTEAPSLADDSNRVPTTSWVNNLVQSNVAPVNYTYKTSSFTAEPNKKYVVDTTSYNITITLPELSGELVSSSIIIRHSAGSNNIIINRAGSNIIVEGEATLTSFTFKGLGSEVELTAYTTYAWVIIRSGRTIEPTISSDTNVAATTAWVRDLVEGNVSNIITLLSGYLKKNSYPTGYQIYEGEFIIDSDWGEKILTLDMPDYGNLNTMWANDYDGIIDVMVQDYDPYVSKLLMSFKDLFTSSPYTEFVQPVKAPTPAAADDSTNIATTAWVQDEIATKADLTDPVFIDSLTIESEANSEPLQFDFQGGLAASKFGFKWDADGDIMKMGTTYDVLSFSSLLEFSSMSNPSLTNIEAKVPIYVPNLGEVAYDDDRVATTEWTNWAISEAGGGGATADPVFTGIVTAPTIFTDLGSNCFKIINPVGGAVSGTTSLVPGAEVAIQFPEVPISNSYRCFIKISIDGRSTIIVEGYISSNYLHGIYVTGSLCQDLTDKVLKIRTGYAPPTSGYFRPLIILGDKYNSLYNIWEEATTVVVEEAVFCTTDDIVEDLKNPFIIEIRNSDIADSGIFYTKYLYPPVTSISNYKLTGGIVEEATPASSSATGTKGMIRYDSNYVYICVATDTWIRIAKDTW